MHVSRTVNSDGVTELQCHKRVLTRPVTFFALPLLRHMYTSLQVSPKKKRCPPELDDANILTPKKLRTALVHF